MKLKFFLIVSAIAIISIGATSIAWKMLYRARYQMRSLNPSIQELSHWWARLEVFGALIFVILFALVIVIFRRFLNAPGVIVIGCILFSSCSMLTIYQILSDPVVERRLEGIGLSSMSSALGVVASILWICFFVILILTVDSISKQKRLNGQGE